MLTGITVRSRVHKMAINPDIRTINDNGYLTIPAISNKKQTYYYWSTVHKEDYDFDEVWKGQPANANCAILCEDIVCYVDFDAHTAEPNGMTVYHKLEQVGTFKGCIIEKTQGDGRHVYFKGIKGGKYTVQIDGISIEVTAGRNLAYCYPTVTEKGGYTFTSEKTLLNTRPEDLPELLEVLARPPKKECIGVRVELSRIPSKQMNRIINDFLRQAIRRAKYIGRNNSGYVFACQLRDMRLTYEQAAIWMLKYQEGVNQ
ncbi:hypothetical protein MCP_1776 [Methanocella paludicola SANAE]|uniref:DNA primase/polymerase bifunctional N-terminal domain-containing protein n=2 Tax=Methanocella TaxID=570266 RepID=D1YZH6_METPS|nr:hypothetical protein MCP_1776 [Methanocella paludicola SANAE]